MFPFNQYHQKFFFGQYYLIFLRNHYRNEAVRDLVCTVRYSNTLPDIPFDPKFMTCNDIFGNTRFIDYKPTSLERNYKYEILTEHDLGVAVDLILPDAYLQQNSQY